MNTIKEIINLYEKHLNAENKINKDFSGGGIKKINRESLKTENFYDDYRGRISL